MSTPVDALEDEKARNVGQLLLKAARLWNEVALQRVRAASGLDVRASHLALLPHVDHAGTRPSEIARRAGMKKQVAGRLLAELEALGLVARVADETDHRAYKVVFTPLGYAGIREGLGVLAGVEADVTARVGRDAVADLRRVLPALVVALEALDRPGS